MALPPIRSSVTPQPGQAVARPADAARTAAQRAFFQAAIGVQAPTASAARPVEAAPTVNRFTPQSSQRASIPNEPPTRVLRPGSFIDIKV
jgi:hypothetical protein